ncbi:uncharacterized protein K02A2.6-like [Uranotaenia lowii]|uniref:uncharacterized protein K02A2.6-like n=1 Tax=Uranotaenia lowii TaxID=190385 RepID=UPI002479DACD|nr:uncharacterized protein K02A2.6-like [Uranotaenia lowii]
MSSQIKETVKQCLVCAKFSASQQNPPMQSHEIPIHPFQVISMDTFLCEQRNEKHKFLITVDHYSDFFEVNRLINLTPEAVINICKENFARYGIPQRVITDNGTNFVNHKMARFASEWNFELVSSSPHHQQANGKAESAVKIAKQLIKKSEESGSDFNYALLHWRNIPNNIGSSPATRLFSRSTRCGIPTEASHLQPKVVENVPDKIEESRRKSKFYYDRKSRKLPQLEIGSPVFVQLNPGASKLWTPATIRDRLSDRAYMVDSNGTLYRRSQKHLKPRKEPDTHSSYTVPEKVSNVPMNSSTSENPQEESILEKQTETNATPDVLDFPSTQRTETSPRPWQ